MYISLLVPLVSRLGLAGWDVELVQKKHQTFFISSTAFIII